MSIWYVPTTPGGTPCFWLKARTEKEAWDKLLFDARHMPYKDKRAFIVRGYTVVPTEWSDDEEGEQQ